MKMQLINKVLKSVPIEFPNFPRSNELIKIQKYIELKVLIDRELNYWEYSIDRNLNSIWVQCRKKLEEMVALSTEQEITEKVRDISNLLTTNRTIISTSSMAVFLSNFTIEEKIKLEKAIELAKYPERVESYINSNNTINKEVSFKYIIHNALISGKYDSFSQLETKYGQDINNLKELFQKSFVAQKEEREQQFETLFAGMEEQLKEASKERGELGAMFDDLYNEIIQWRSKQEETYQEKLKLAAPAEYWHKLSDNYSKNSRNWGKSTALSAIGFILFLMVLLFGFDSWASAFEGENKLKAIIIFSLIVTVFTFLIGLSAKIALSNMHLSRDAAEREQLTYFYLSLVNDSAKSNNHEIKEQERLLIFQSLFSRADTGLIKGDTSPTMPGIGLIEKLITKK